MSAAKETLLCASTERLTRKRFDTLDAEYTHLVYEACRLVDARDAGDTKAAAQLELVRARRAAVKAELRRRMPSYDRWER